MIFAWSPLRNGRVCDQGMTDEARAHRLTAKGCDLIVDLFALAPNCATQVAKLDSP